MEKLLVLSREIWAYWDAKHTPSCPVQHSTLRQACAQTRRAFLSPNAMAQLVSAVDCSDGDMQKRVGGIVSSVHVFTRYYGMIRTRIVRESEKLLDFMVDLVARRIDKAKVLHFFRSLFSGSFRHDMMGGRYPHLLRRYY